ncbi:hypothetical protein F7725_006115 [Dissostichus mawsoni]|uniref:Uncharacterized protein n=1 Tax=Dissostichus mawsoni TaxID=36200 RepID=A0A7J5YTI3_DISMA|nr:hypothetical protein F7725_006115 [Dissostichus mawsoni]
MKNREFPLIARRRRSGSAPERKVNCVLVGDGAVGKTSLIVSYTTNGYPPNMCPQRLTTLPRGSALSLRNLVDRWLPEIRHQCPDTPLVLVGTQLDLREDVQVLIQLAQNQQRPVGTEEGRQLAEELGMVGFMEVSALTQKNLKDPFDSAILASIQQTEMESCSEGGR